jgi:thioredoxin reductase (NADPH)
VLVRGTGLSSTMSHYLIERIEGAPNITVLAETEIVELLGTPDVGLQGVRWRNRRTGAEEHHAIAHLFLFTGADPAAGWLNGGIPIDEKGFIRTGADAGSGDRSPLPLETGVDGIFAVGDVRCGSVKRVGAAIGEGAAVVAQLHTFLARSDRPPAGAMRVEARRSASPLS